LEDVQDLLGVDNQDVQVLAVGQELGGDDLQLVGSFAEELEMVGILLFTHH
jgi:hypothetical protein